MLTTGPAKIFSPGPSCSRPPWSGSVERQTVETVNQWKGRMLKLWISGKADCGNYESVERQNVETVDQWKGRLWKLWVSGKADCGNCGSVERQTVETVDQWKDRLWKLWISGKADCGNCGSNWTDMRFAVPLVLILSMAQQLLVGHDFFIIEVSLRHTTFSRIHSEEW